MLRLLAACAVAGCAAQGYSPPAYQPIQPPRPMPQLWQGHDPALFLGNQQTREQQFPVPPRPTWCRPDGYGGVICS